MNISFLQNNEWSKFKNFFKKNLVNNIIANKNFTKYWFNKYKKIWQIQISKDSNNNICAVNMHIKDRARFNQKKIFLIWTSLAFSEKNIKNKGIVGLMLLNLHRSLPLIVSTCGNKNSLPLNNQLGFKIPKLKMKRFIYVHNLECLNIVKKKFRNNLKKNVKFKKLGNNDKLKISWKDKIPEDIDKLWSKFSKYFKICIAKDKKYLIWRYENSPFQIYKFLSFRNYNNVLIGLVIIRFQKTNFGNCARIVDLILEKKYLDIILNNTLMYCETKNSLFTDFIHVGDIFNKQFHKAGFKIANTKNKLDEIPNLFSPLDYRKWSNTFHLGGYLAIKNKHKLHSKNIWFTKGDGDRDWPTINDV